MLSLAVELGFGQKFKSDPRVEKIRQLNSRIEQLELEEIESVTYKFLGFEQKLLFNPRIELDRVARHVRNPILLSRYVCFESSLVLKKTSSRATTRIEKN
jgi:hypothetical protein